MNIQSLIRYNIRQLKPYSSARGEYSGYSKILLDANENPFDNGMNRYPDPLQINLKNELAIINGVQPENIFLGNGSDEIIDLLIRVFCEPNEDEVMVLPPTFGMYEVAASLSNIKVKKINLTPEFQPDVDQILNEATPQTKILFLCSPNNPTGNCFQPRIIENLIKNHIGIVVVDEAYIDFSEYDSVLNWIRKYPNLVVIQTFSKAWGLAGIRLGMGFASKEIIEVLNKVKMPYNVNVLTQKMALEAVQNLEEKNTQVNEILIQKAILKKGLVRFEFVEKVYPSDANFFLLKVKNPQKLIHFLRGKGIIIRDRSKTILCENCVRISVGTNLENEQLLRALKLYNSIK